MEALQLELEALKNIYFDQEFTVKEENDKLSIETYILPTSHSSKPSHVAVNLIVTASRETDYPGTENPCVTIVPKKGIDNTRKRALESIVAEVFESNQGFEVLFDLFNRVQQWLNENNRAQARSIHEQLAKGADEEQDSSNESLDLNSSNDQDESDNPAEEKPCLQAKDIVPEDERVTEEQFHGWARQFKQEMIASGIWSFLDEKDPRLTGRQIFLKAASSGTANIDDMIPADAGAQSVFWRNNALYDGDEDDEILDQLSNSDGEVN